jgi:hypothetical protein
VSCHCSVLINVAAIEEATETWNAIEYVGARLEKLVKFSIPILQV